MHLDPQMWFTLAPGLSSHGREQHGDDVVGVARDLGRLCGTDGRGVHIGQQNLSQFKFLVKHSIVRGALRKFHSHT